MFKSKSKPMGLARPVVRTQCTCSFYSWPLVGIWFGRSKLDGG